MSKPFTPEEKERASRFIWRRDEAVIQPPKDEKKPEPKK